MPTTSYDTTYVAQSTIISAPIMQSLNDLAWRGRNPLYCISTGTGIDYTITLPTGSLYNTLVAGDSFLWKCHLTSTGPATLTVVGQTTLTAIPLLDANKVALAAGTLTAGTMVVCTYDGTSFQTNIGAISSLAGSTGSNLVGFISAGTGAVARTVQSKLRDFINVKDFGALGNAVTDDTTAINAAIVAAAGRTLYFPGGTYKTTGVTVANEVTIQGEGYSRSQLSLIAGGTTPVMTINGASHVCVQDFSVDGNKVNCPSGMTGIRIIGTCTGPEFNRVFFVNCKTDGLSQAGVVDYIIVRDCIAETNGNDGFSIATATKALVSGNRAVLNGRYGIIVTGSLARIESNVCSGNANAVAGGSGIGLVNAANYSVITGNESINNGVAGSIYAHGIGVGSSDYITITSNYCASNVGNGIDYTTNGSVGCKYTSTVGNLCLANYDNGIAIDSQSHYATVANNVVVASMGAGIFYYASAYGVCTGNELYLNGNSPGQCAFAGSGSYPFGIYLDGYSNAGTDYYCFNTNISNNLIQGSTYATTGRGLKVINGAVTPALNNIITGNTFLNNTQHVDTAQGAIYKARDNFNWLTQNSGTSSIASAATSVVVTHGLAVTPTADAITITTTGLCTSDPGQIYITSITSTQFTVNCRTAPGASTLAFSWRASVY